MIGERKQLVTVKIFPAKQVFLKHIKEEFLRMNQCQKSQSSL